MNPLRPMRLLHGAYLFSKSANLIFKIIIDCSFLREDLKNRVKKTIREGRLKM